MSVDDETEKLYSSLCQGYAGFQTTRVEPHKYMSKTKPFTDEKTGLQSHSVCDECKKLYDADLNFIRGEQNEM